MRLLLFCLLACSLWAQPPALRQATQAVVVVSPSWDSVDAKLYRLERSMGRWQVAGAAVPVVVGKKGMAWGETGQSGIVKREGDGRSPAGVFPIVSLFGSPKELKGAQLPYQQLTPATECVDDAASPHYNRIVENTKVRPDWQSSEQMLAVGEPYRYGAVVAYNAQPVQRGAGSCIFLHIANLKQPHRGTAGCTAMEPDVLLTLLRWLRPGVVLVQMPQAEYQRRAGELGLPQLP